LGLLRSFSKDTIVYGLGSSLKKFIGFFLLPFYTRALTPSDFGILETLGTATFFMTALFNLGLDQGCGRYFFMAKTPEEKGQILYNLLVFRVIFVFPSVFLMFFSRQISVALFKTDQYSGVVLLSCFLFPLTVLNTDQDNIFRYFREPWKFNFVTIIRILLGISLGISLVVVMKKGVFGAQLASLVGSFLILIVSYGFFTRRRYTYRFSVFWAKKMLRYSLPLVWAGLASWVFYSSDRFFILRFKGTTEVGLYSIGNMLSQPLWLLNTALKQSYAPFILDLYEGEASAEKPATKSMSTNIWYLYLVLAATLGTFLSIFSVDLLKIVTTPAFLLGALAMPFLIFTTLASESVELVSIGMGFKEKSGYFPVLLSVAALISVSLNFYLVPKYGFVGAAFTTFISTLSYFLLSYLVSQKLFYVKRKELNMIFYLMAMMGLSIIFPFAQLVYHLKIDLWVKIAAFLAACSFPFLTGFLSVKTLKAYLKEMIS